MKSSKKSPDPSSAIPAEAHFAAEGGAVYFPSDNRDPFEALDELMTVVEALCPRWPERDERTAGSCFRL
jgi:hypothetical protein